MRGGKWELLPDSGQWQAALALYEHEKVALHSGRTPLPQAGTLTVADLCNAFLSSKQRLLQNRELAARTFADYEKVCDRLVAFLGKRRLVEDVAAGDFEALRTGIAKTCGLIRLGGQIQQTRMVFKYGFDAGLLDKPVRYGQSFQRPHAVVIRKLRNSSVPKMFEAHEIRDLLAAAPTQLRAMILLGVNCGFGNCDCGNLPQSALDFDKGWVHYPRPKTGIDRRCPLWLETVETLNAAIADRPAAKYKADAGLVFLTRCGQCWSKATSTNPISAEFGKLCKTLGLHRRGRGFYALRHTFQTIGDEALDAVAIRMIMGHSPPSGDMSSVYRERISDKRLLAVVDHVRQWLFGPGAI